MMIIMKAGTEKAKIERVIERVRGLGLQAHLSEGKERTVIGVIGDGRPIQKDLFIYLPGVDRILPISRPYKLASKEFCPDNTRIKLDGVTIGSGQIVLIAGPCAVESRTLFLETAHAVREAGGHALRGGVFKPRTSPYSFQGVCEKGFEWLVEAKEQTGLPIVTEVMDPIQVAQLESVADVLQIGARNMQNFSLLHAVGETQHPIMLKRGMSATVEDLLMAAEYILSHGNRQVILCERGIRTFETATRNTVDINAIPVLKHQTHLPVIVDPSHGTGHWEYVESVSLAAIAAGADGLMIEVHPTPEEALSDGGQSLKPERFAKLVKRTANVAKALGKEMANSITYNKEGAA
jgi:3-deoxy-7-phosphoheptulonate synthase